MAKSLNLVSWANEPGCWRWESFHYPEKGKEVVEMVEVVGSGQVT